MCCERNHNELSPLSPLFNDFTSGRLNFISKKSELNISRKSFFNMRAQVNQVL